MPIHRAGRVIGFRPASKVGVPDILGIIPPSGTFLGVEIKTGRDKLRPEQKVFIEKAREFGAVCLVVASFEDFLSQWLTMNNK